MAGRPKQPSCPKCSKALYKRPDAGGVLTTDPYAWCRNQACTTFGKDQSGSSRFGKSSSKDKPKQQELFKPSKAPKAVEKPVEKPAKVKTEKRTVIDDIAEAVSSIEDESDVESDAVKTARARIRAITTTIESQYSKQLIAVALAIVAQETGSPAAANALIREHNLEKKYGIKERKIDGKSTT